MPTDARVPERILMTADPIGGVWTYALDLCRELGARGARVLLAVMGGEPTAQQAAEALAVPGLRVRVGNYRLEWMDDPWADVDAAGDWLLGLARDFRPDVVHLNTYPHGHLPWGAPVLVVGHSCVLSWWRAVRREPAPPSWGEYRRAVRRGLAAADLVVAPTAAMLAELRRHYKPLPESRVIPNGRAAPPAGAGPKEPLILSVGRLWDAAKNLQALQKVARRLPWPVYVAGEAAHPGGGTASTRGLYPLGRLSPVELADWYGRAAVYALPARYEPFGLSALEAALAGCALVLGDIPSLREVWGTSALYVRPDDTKALEEAVWKLILDPAARANLGEQARRRALGMTAARMASGYADAYRGLLRRGRRAKGPGALAAT